MSRSGKREIVYVGRGDDASAKWLFFGAVVGAGLALLYAPQSGEETRRSLQRTLWKLRAMTEEKLDELSQQMGGAMASFEDLGDDALDDDDAFDERETPEARAASPREEVERRLAETRARRRGDALEEPLA